MNQKQFKAEFDRLVAAFVLTGYMDKASKSTLAEYWEVLRLCPAEIFKQVVTHAIATGEKFPAAATLRRYWHEIQAPGVDYSKPADDQAEKDKQFFRDVQRLRELPECERSRLQSEAEAQCLREPFGEESQEYPIIWNGLVQCKMVDLWRAKK
jgi:hypothetical protein